MSAYLMRLVCAAILCAMIDALCGTNGGIRKLTAGIFLTLVAFSIPTELDLPALDPERFISDARAAAEEGAEASRNEQAERIIDACESYVWNKARAMGIDVTARITLDGDLHPSRAELTGDAPPTERQTLTAELAAELGIREEDVVWTNSHQSSA